MARMELVRTRTEAGGRPIYRWRCGACGKEGKMQKSRSLARTIGRRHVEKQHADD